MTEKEYAKYLWELISPHADYWDCYNDEPLEEDHTMELCNLFLDEIINKLELFDSMKCLVLYYKKVKKELKNIFKDE